MSLWSSNPLISDVINMAWRGDLMVTTLAASFISVELCEALSIEITLELTVSFTTLSTAVNGTPLFVLIISGGPMM
jgi:hypothetical protein